MSRLQVAVRMCRRVRKVSRHGVVCADFASGRFNGYTWRARIKVVGADTAEQAARWLT